MPTAHTDGTILVLAPLGRDAELTARLLAGAGLRCRLCDGPDALRSESLDAVAALILTQEALSDAALGTLRGILDAQPGWSTLPVIALISGDGTSASAPSWPGSSQPVAGLVVLERPIRPESFLSVIRAAVHGRRRQFQLRDEFAARAAAEAHARLLAGEMKHRIKNSLTLVGAIAAQTFRDDAGSAAALGRFSERLKAIARAQDVLTGESDVSADLGALVERALEPHRGVGAAGRFSIDGPAVRLPVGSATALAMALHELATNALKYGALSREAGEVTLRWRVEPADRGAELHLEWRERGGPPVTLPAHRGFGSSLVERALAAELHGCCAIAFEPGGVVCRISAPLPSGAEG